jgi:hypothetical protein
MCGDKGEFMQEVYARGAAHIYLMSLGEWQISTSAHCILRNWKQRKPIWIECRSSRQFLVSTAKALRLCLSAPARLDKFRTERQPGRVFRDASTRPADEEAPIFRQVLPGCPCRTSDITNFVVLREEYGAAVISDRQ